MKIVAVEPLGINPSTQKTLIQEWAQLGHVLKIYNQRTEDPTQLIERIDDADILLVSNIPIQEPILSQCPNLKLISVAFTGLDHIDLNYCKSKGIVVKNCAGYATTAVAELAIGLMLDVYRQITILDQKTRNEGTRNNYLGKQLKGKTLGIVGTGAIGLETAKLALAFGCKVIAWSRSERQEAIYLGIPYVTLPELMSQSDIISLHTPLNNETFHLINRDLLKLCKKTAVLINTARGNVVDINAVADALNTGTLAGAAFDVFEQEPPIPQNHPLITSPNCVLVPHIAYATEESFEERVNMVFQNVKSLLNITFAY
ncbi:MAG TPA: NAD(P)-dependent oxidoreductase [Bacteroidales bacterium]|nr:NAD(P)-dependent oxidoreductase [Bacteroidales bacterium]HPS71523.1 NAD(P)-dependent oxidoreductase [Bacteroidales bacterium]